MWPAKAPLGIKGDPPGAVLTGNVVPAQSVTLVLAAAPWARDGMATIFSIVLSANAVAVVSNRDLPLLAMAVESTAAPPTRPKANTTMAIISSIRLNPRQRVLNEVLLLINAIRLPHSSIHAPCRQGSQLQQRRPRGFRPGADIGSSLCPPDKCWLPILSDRETLGNSTRSPAG